MSNRIMTYTRLDVAGVEGRVIQRLARVAEVTCCHVVVRRHEVELHLISHPGRNAAW